jgi:UDP-N-acetylmuramate--alanine ligase
MLLLGTDTEMCIQTSSLPRGGIFLGRRIHLIGIGGSGMRAMAKMLLERGATVTGSDMSAGLAVQSLTAAGAKIRTGRHSAENIPDDCELVVHTAAVKDDNLELAAARARGIEIAKYSRLLGWLMDHADGIAVSGTHGKSTTSAMVAYVLRAAGTDPSFVIGAVVPQLGGPSGAGSGRHFVAEACEFDRSFLNLRPAAAVILNIEEDHLDYYRDLTEIVGAFADFARNVRPDGLLVINGECPQAPKAALAARCRVETFGLADHCDWRAAIHATQAGRHDISVLYHGREFCRFTTPLPGRHNVYNCLAAAALLHHAGVQAGRIAGLLPQFRGAERRMTLKGAIGGVTVLDDYAHHPTEIAATLKAIREHYAPRRLFCVFQPHQHSRTRFLLKDFARSFTCADLVVVPDIYFVRDDPGEKDCIRSEDLVSQIELNQGPGSALYLRDFPAIVSHLTGTLTKDDAVVTMGAGDIWEVADEIVRWLGRNRNG